MVEVAVEVRAERGRQALLNGLAMSNVAIDSKLRGCDVVALTVETPNGCAIDRGMVRQKNTGRPVNFELTDQTRQVFDDYLRASGKKPGEFYSRAAGGPVAA